MDDLLDNAPCGFLTLTDEGTVQTVNTTLLTLLGYDTAELCGRHIGTLLSVAGRVFFQTHFFPLLMLHGKAEEIYLSLRSKAGADVPVLANAARRQRDGAFVTDCVLVPMSQRRRYEDELLRAKKLVEEASARQLTFMQDVLLSVTDGVLRLCAAPADLPAPLPPAGEPISLSSQEAVVTLRRLTASTALTAGMDQERRDGLATAVGEAGMNAVRHAEGGVGRVGVGADGTVQVRIVDHGRGISLENLPNATLRKGFTTAGTLGHGMKLMLQTADRVFLLTGTGGTTVVLEQERIPTAPPSPD